jgi:HPt (histidine-containing phosphotransfer) domain-containing protein
MDYLFLKNRNFDVDGTIERFAGKTDLYEKYIRLFLEEKSYFQLEDAVKNLDYTETENNVHALKGLAGNLGINSVYNASCLMLKELRTGDKNRAIELFDFVKEEFLQACEVIKTADS